MNDNTKRILGKLFKKYKDDQNRITIDIENANLSSINTFYNACKGLIIQNDEFYINYCNYFNHPFEIKEEFYEWYPEFEHRLLKSFDYINKIEIKELCNEFNNEMKDCANHAIYHEYLVTLNYLFDYYLEEKYLNLAEINNLLDLLKIGIFSNDLSIYILDCIFRSNNNYVGDKELPNEIIKKMKEIDSNNFYTLFVEAAIHKYNFNYLKSLTLFKQCYDITVEKNNINRKIQCLMALYGIYRDTDKEMEEITSNELLELKKFSLPENIKLNINYNIGMQDYLKGRYERAYELFNENIEKYQSYNCLLFLCAVCNRINKDYPKVMKFKEIENRHDFTYINYYIKKDLNVQSIELAEYIMNEIFVDKLQYEKYREPYWNLFEYELSEMTKKDIKVRKYYLEYINLLKTTCKN